MLARARGTVKQILKLSLFNNPSLISVHKKMKEYFQPIKKGSEATRNLVFCFVVE